MSDLLLVIAGISVLVATWVCVITADRHASRMSALLNAILDDVIEQYRDDGYPPNVSELHKIFDALPIRDLLTGFVKYRKLKTKSDVIEFGRQLIEKEENLQ